MKLKSYSAQYKVIDQSQGIFEALVAVFDNVDRGGDRILKGAFAQTLKDWLAKGRPIPVVFSHQWDNLDAHIGQVLEAKETDEGLLVKAQLEMDEPFAQRVFKKMAKSLIAEFSFAYDTVKANLVDQGEKVSPRYVNDLEQLDLFEVGPCLVGMNPATQLLGVKSGARNSAADARSLQSIHDLVCGLGAKCESASDGEPEDPPADESLPGKSAGRTSTLAELVALELLESDE